MSTIVLLDSDFLSVFLKIGRITLVRDFYQIERIYLIPAVYREIAQTTLLSNLITLHWLALTTPDLEQLTKLRQYTEFNRLGAGEQEAIAVALEQQNGVLLTNDNKARQFATSLGVTVINIPAFLLACNFIHPLSSSDLSPATLGGRHLRCLHHRLNMQPIA